MSDIEKITQSVLGIDATANAVADEIIAAAIAKGGSLTVQDLDEMRDKLQVRLNEAVSRVAETNDADAERDVGFIRDWIVKIDLMKEHQTGNSPKRRRDFTIQEILEFNKTGIAIENNAADADVKMKSWARTGKGPYLNRSKDKHPLGSNYKAKFIATLNGRPFVIDIVFEGDAFESADTALLAAQKMASGLKVDEGSKGIIVLIDNLGATTLYRAKGDDDVYLRSDLKLLDPDRNWSISFPEFSLEKDELEFLEQLWPGDAEEAQEESSGNYDPDLLYNPHTDDMSGDFGETADLRAALKTGADTTSPDASPAISTDVDFQTQFIQATTAQEWGAALVSLRKERGVSMNEMARRLGKNTKSILRLEKGEVRPRIDTIELYLKALDPSLKMGIGAPRKLTK